MKNKKPWYKSKTIVGILIAIAPNIVSIFGLHLTEGMMDNLAALVGGVLSIYGRITADSGISAKA